MQLNSILQQVENISNAYYPPITCLYDEPHDLEVAETKQAQQQTQQHQLNQTQLAQAQQASIIEVPVPFNFRPHDHISPQLRNTH